MREKSFFKAALLVVITTFFALSSVSPTMVHAAEAETDLGQESITLSPVSKRYEVQTGQVLEDELTIINDGKTDYEFVVYARPYSVNGEAYDPSFTSTLANADAYQWVQFSKTRFMLKAGESTKVAYSLRVPENSVPGGHYGVLFAETQPPESSSGDSVVRKKRVGTILYATVKGSYQVGGELLSTSIPFLQFRSPLNSQSSVKNSGNTDFVDKLTYTVKDVFGNVKHQAEREYPVLPQTTRKFQLDWEQAPWFGLFKVDVHHKFLDQDKTTSGYVLIVPRWLLIAFAIVILGGAAYVVLRKRR